MRPAQEGVISNRSMSEEEDRFQRFKVMLQQTGGDPSGVLDSLCVIFLKKDWVNLTDRHGGNITFEGYFKALGWSLGDLLRFVENMRHRHEIRPKIDRGLVTKAKIVASDRGIDTAMYLSEALRPIVERDWVKIVKRIEGSNPKDEGSRS
jgi:hypothetical protein